MWSGTCSRGAQTLHPHCCVFYAHGQAHVSCASAPCQGWENWSRGKDAFGQPSETPRLHGSLSCRDRWGLKLNCNIKFCCELSPPWCFIMTSLCQMHCYCLVSITSMNTSFIYIYAKFQFLLTLLGCWKSNYLHFSTAAWLLPVAELSIVWCIFMWLSFSVKTFVKLYSHSLSTSVWCSHKLLWGGWTWHDPAGARTWL